MDGSQTTTQYLSEKKIDTLFIIGSPLLAFLMIALFCEPRLRSGEFLHNPNTPSWLIIIAILLTKSHILLVFVRSHMNKEIYDRFPLRFTLIPLLMLIAMSASPIFFGIMSFIALYWDEWHSLMQTFGFGRIYDAKIGNDPKIGRNLDIGMCFVLGLLPHVILLTFIPETIRTQGLQEYLDLNRDIAINYGSYFSSAKYPLIFFGISYIIYYFYRYYFLIRNGYIFSKAKLALFITTGLSATLMALFYSVEEAAYFGNIYHAIQYYLIIYISEGSLMRKKISIKKVINPTPKIFYFFIFLMISVIFAALRIKTEGFGILAAFWLLTSLMHFWYDGFIWSVRKKDLKIN